MDAPLPLAALGPRIMVIGPTNSGKSTLAHAIAEQLGVPAVHLDQFRHLPHTNWVERDDAEFAALHNAAVLEPAWIMDGNYRTLIAGRVARATGIIVLDGALATRAWRYVWRTVAQRKRAGGLDGDRDSIKWEMVHWLWATRNKGEQNRRFAAETGLPTVFCRTSKDLDRLYAVWRLEV